jgi:hypothetical protein
MYSELQIELEGYHKDDENSYLYYRDDEIIIKIYYLGIELWEAIEKVVWLQIKQLERNKIIMKRSLNLEFMSDLKY